MKVVILFFLLISFNLFSQAPEIVWENKYGFNNDDEFYSVINVGGSYALTGMYNDMNNVPQSWLVSISEDGLVFWQKKFTYPGKNIISSISLNSNYSYTIVGYTYEKRGFRRDLYYMRLSSTGQKLYRKILGGRFKDAASNVISISDGGNLIYGYFTDTDNENLWAIRVNKYGAELWKKTYDYYKNDQSVSAVQTNDNSFVLCSNVRIDNDWNVMLIKLDKKNGIEKWHKNIGNEYNNFANDIISTQDNAFVLCGTTENREKAKNFWIVKINSEGDIIWEKSLGQAMNEEANAIYERINGNYIVCGYIETAGSGMLDFWVMEFDKDGNQLWNKTYGTEANDIAYDLTEASDGGIIIVGSTFNGDNKLDGWVIKIK